MIPTPCMTSAKTNSPIVCPCSSGESHLKRPNSSVVGIAPEWFYMGNCSTLRAHRETLLVPAYAEDGGEEAEVAACYIITPDGEPYRLGMTPGNEFSDHVFEKRNYLNLAGSKLRMCSLGPNLS
jgi:hypothetical protein